jgi:preprotein translocase subunit SecE
VAKVNPGKFLNEVKVETAKVSWPRRQDVVRTTIMVVIMTSLLGIFFFGVDSAFSAIVKFLLSLIG